MNQSPTGPLPAAVEVDEAAGVKPARGAFYRWYMLALLLLIYIFGAVDRSVVSVIAEPLRHEFNLSDAQIGALGGLAYSATFGIFVLPLGWLVDRTNRRVLLSLSVMVWSVLTMCGAVSQNFIQLVLARLGVGAAEAGASPASFSMITDIFPLSQRNTAISIYYAGAPGGQIVIFLLGGWLLMHFEWRVVFLVAGIPGLILAALLFFTGREPVRGAQDAPVVRKADSEPGDAEAPLSFVRTMREIAIDPALRNAILGTMLCTGVNSTLMIWFTSFLVRMHEIPVSKAAISVGLGYGISATAATVLIGPIADRYSRGEPARLAHIPALMTFLGLFAGYAMCMADTYQTAMVWLVIFSGISGFFNGPGYALTLSLARPAIRGSTMAVAKLMVIVIGSGLLPVLTGMVSDFVGGAHSIRPAIAFTVSMLAVASVFFVLAGRAAARRP